MNRALHTARPSPRDTARASASSADDVSGGEKRRRVEVNDDSKIELPADLWSVAMEYLHCSDAVQCCAVSRAFVHDVAPRVETLRLMRREDLTAATARRFRNVKTVFILCSLEFEESDQEEDEDLLLHSLDKDVIFDIVPFASRLPALECIHFGGNLPQNGAMFEYCHQECLSDSQNEAINGLVCSFSSAYRFGLLRPTVCVTGIACPDEAPKGMSCRLCLKMYKSFPLRSVMGAQHRGTRCYNTDAELCNKSCFSVEEHFQMIASRKGGLDAINSSFLLEKLKRSTTKQTYDIKDGKDGNKAVCIWCNRQIMGECEELIKYCDLKEITSEDVYTALTSGPVEVVDKFLRSNMRKSFSLKRGTSKCYFRRDIFDQLANMGIPVDEDDFFVE